MTLKTDVERLKVEIETLEAAIGKADPAPMIIDIRNDPERRRPGPDAATIGGQVYLRDDNEDRGQFGARPRAAAVAAAEQLICVSLADDESSTTSRSTWRHYSKREKLNTSDRIKATELRTRVLADALRFSRRP
jgi:hypothetical protein